MMIRPSFVRLVFRTVLAFWAVGFLTVGAYTWSSSWSGGRAQTDGVFLFYELLEATPESERASRLEALKRHTAIDYTLVSAEDLKARFSLDIQPGEHIPYREAAHKEWYFLAFSDGSAILAAGPVNPAIPPGLVPLGLYLGIIALPIIGGLLALRVERQIRKVERASQAIAVGQLSARVDNPEGPSHELAVTFNAMADRIERLVRSREELVQAVSHELGSPLNRLRFHIELLRASNDTQRPARLEAMSDDLDALDDLVTELLSYVQSDETELHQQRFAPQKSLEDLAELAHLDAPNERDILVETELADGVILDVDPRLFQRAIENLLRNAVHHTRTRVLLRLRDDHGAIRVEVHDDGPGIPRELREQVVNPFVRLDPDRGRKTGGAGLGLAIVTRILTRHGGRLEIDRSPLGGAQMTTVWPTSA